MAITYLKKTTKTAAIGVDQTEKMVRDMLVEIESSGKSAVVKYASDRDGFSGNRFVAEAKPMLFGRVSAGISRLEGMEGHAMSGDVRLRKYFPGETFNTGVS